MIQKSDSNYSLGTKKKKKKKQTKKKKITKIKMKPI